MGESAEQHRQMGAPAPTGTFSEVCRQGLRWSAVGRGRVGVVHVRRVRTRADTKAGKGHRAGGGRIQSHGKEAGG